MILISIFQPTALLWTSAAGVTTKVTAQVMTGGSTEWARRVTQQQQKRVPIQISQGQTVILGTNSLAPQVPVASFGGSEACSTASANAPNPFNLTRYLNLTRETKCTRSDFNNRTTTAVSIIEINLNILSSCRCRHNSVCCSGDHRSRGRCGAVVGRIGAQITNPISDPFFVRRYPCVHSRLSVDG